MTQRDLKEIEKDLTCRLEESCRRFGQTLTEIRRSEQAPFPDYFDQAAHHWAKESSLVLTDRALARIRAIRKSLQDIAEGVYGICDCCEEPIALRRLEVVPEARRCVYCQESFEG